MKVRAEEQDNYIVLIIPEDITFQNYIELKSEIDKAIHVFPQRWMVLDFTMVNFINSSGIGLVVDILKTLRQRKGGLFIIHCKDTIERLFVKTRLHKDVLIMEDGNAVTKYLQSTY